LVDIKAGINVLAPNLNWRKVPVKEVMSAQLGLPVVADNNVRCMALGEAYFGIGRELSSLAFVYGRIGVGAGFIYQGDVFRGSSMGAGEIGHTTLLLQGGEPCRCGKTGCLETLVSETAYLFQAQEISRLNPDGILAKVINDNPNGHMMTNIVEAAQQGDEPVQKMLADRAHYLGVALANMVNLYNPEMIILGGVFTQAGKYFMDPLKKTVRRMSFGDLGTQVRIEATGFGWKAGVIGAAALALTHLFYLCER
jgi:predicted NBD/HSP70 family sugar kinase